MESRGTLVDTEFMTQAQASLIGDIGATNVRFLILEHGSYTCLHRWHGKVADFPDPSAAIETALQPFKATFTPAPEITAAVLGIAGPVDGGDRVRMINHPWAFSQSELCAHFGWQSLRVINDFEAAARGALMVPDTKLLPVGPQRQEERLLPRAVLGPGTGLGVAGLIPGDTGWQILSTESGHVRFAPATDEELALLRALRLESPCVQREDLLSGPGLCNIYYGLAEVRGKLVRTIHEPEAITREALADDESFCADVLNLFCALLGTAAADIALSLGAQGGILLTGGILPYMGDFLRASEFRSRFDNHPRMEEYLQAINVNLITHKDLGLLGMEQLLRQRGTEIPKVEVI